MDVCISYQSSFAVPVSGSPPNTVDVYLARGTFSLITPAGDTLLGAVTGFEELVHGPSNTLTDIGFTLSSSSGTGQFRGTTGTIGLNAQVTFSNLARRYVFTGGLSGFPSGTGHTCAGVPRSVTATASGTGRATVSWQAPTSDGGSPITGYVVTPFVAAGDPYVGFNENGTSTNSTATTATVTGLRPGDTYTFEVAAINALGQGPQSLDSNAVKPK